MPVSITHMRELMMPGLLAMKIEYKVTGYDQWGKLFTETIAVAEAVPLPTVSLPAAAAMGVAAVVIATYETRNPRWACDDLGSFRRLIS